MKLILRVSFASLETLDLQELKKLLQGEVLYVPQKGTMATKVNYNSGIYITCNELPQISGENGEAIYDRLEVFKAQPIRKVKASCKRKFREKCMKVRLAIYIYY